MAGVTKGFPPPDNSGDILSSSTWSLPQIEQYYQQYPGAAPGGSGETGLAPNDAEGWSALQNLQTRYMQLKGLSPTIEAHASVSGGDMNTLNKAAIDNPWTPTSSLAALKGLV